MERVQITFLRYAGSKRRLVSYIKGYLQPPDLIPGRYIDPFVGGGGVFLSLDFNEALLSDINRELMDLYRAIKQDPIGVWSIFESYPSTKRDYYRIRNNKKVSKLDLITRAARTLYLNRTCFRGWWRYNAQGQFNVGYGGQGRRWAITEDDLIAVSRKLENVTILDGDFENVINSSQFGDFVLEGEPMETLKWIAYRKWDMQPKQLPLFGCPHCEKTVATLPYDAEEGSCPSCGNHLFLTDMLGFHLEMAEDSAPQSLAMSYMGVHETLLLFTAIRHFWHEHQELLAKCLFVKDGPLYLRAQYSKLVNPIRDFLVHAEDSGHPVHLIGQEKTGKFHDHLQMIGRDAPVGCLFIPDGDYITREINHSPDSKTPYGKDTNYGSQSLCKA
jgi:DNA adenine methylase Dam